jgi:hypothetical protein
VDAAGEIVGYDGFGRDISTYFLAPSPTVPDAYRRVAGTNLRILNNIQIEKEVYSSLLEEIRIPTNQRTIVIVENDPAHLYYIDVRHGLAETVYGKKGELNVEVLLGQVQIIPVILIDTDDGRQIMIENPSRDDGYGISLSRAMYGDVKRLVQVDFNPNMGQLYICFYPKAGMT